MRKSQIGVVLLLLAWALPGQAAPIIDGLFDAGEGYQVEVPLTLSYGGPDTEEAWLFYAEDAATGDVSAALVLPTTLVDNSYGANSIGWGKGVAPSGRSHTFNDLLNSDRARFLFKDALGETLIDVSIDYLTRVKDAWAAGLDAEGTIKMGDDAHLLEVSSSLAWNLANVGEFLVDSPRPEDEPNWVFPVIYEFRLSGAAFGAGGFASLETPVVHASPNKRGRSRVDGEAGIPKPLPEPLTPLLLALAAGAGAFYRRRRGRAATQLRTMRTA